MPNRKRITLRDVAKEAGVSHSTVSRALHDNPKIPEKTRQRIKKIADKLGYSSDPMLSALTHYRHARQEKPVQASLAWINLFDPPEKLRQFHVFDLYWKGAFDTARNFGYHLEEFRLAELPIHRLDNILKARGIRGLLLSPSSYTDEQLRSILDKFPWGDYATIRFGQSALSVEVNFISSAQVSNTITLFEKIYSKGYKRIGFVGTYFRKFLFAAGYWWAQQGVPEEQRLPPLLYKPHETRPHLQSMLAEWMIQQKPDAVIFDHFQIMSIMENLNYRIPEDVALCALSINDMPFDTGIDQNPEEIGRAAIRSLVSQLHENRLGIPNIQSEILVEGHWVDGSSVPDKR